MKKLLLLLYFFAFTAHSASVTLEWNPVTGTNISYRVYESKGTQSFSLIGSATTNPQATIDYDPAVTTRWYVTAFSTAYQIQESEPSNIVTKSPPPPPLSGLTFEAESGSITAPFYINGTVVQQDIQTGAADGGRASYLFTITNAGMYTVSVMVNAPSGEADSFFVNIDGEPNDLTIWDVTPVTSGIQERKVQWRSDTAPHQFNLGASQHILVIRGREPGAQLDRISIIPVATTPPPPIPGPPPTPQNLRANAISYDRIDVGWTLSEPAIVKVERSQASSGPFAEIGTVQAGNTFFINGGLVKNRWYYYRVRSWNQGVFSSYSNLAWDKTFRR